MPGPVSSHVRQVEVVCRRRPKTGLMAYQHFAGVEGMPLGQRVGGRVIHRPLVVGRAGFVSLAPRAIF